MGPKADKADQPFRGPGSDSQLVVEAGIFAVDAVLLLTGLEELAVKITLLLVRGTRRRVAFGGGQSVGFLLNRKVFLEELTDSAGAFSGFLVRQLEELPAPAPGHAVQE